MGVFGNNNTTPATVAVPHRWAEMGLPHDSVDGTSSMETVEEVEEYPETPIDVNIAQQNKSGGNKKLEDESPVPFPTNPEENASLLSRLTFSYQYPLFKLAKQRSKQGSGLEASDIFPLRSQDTTKSLGEKFQPLWIDGRKRGYDGARLLAHCISGVVRNTILLCVLLSFLQAVVRMMYPILINQFLSYLTDENADSTNEWEGYVYSILLALTTIGSSVLESQTNHYLYRSGLKTRSMLSTAVFRKSLALSQASRAKVTTGEIINYLQLDTYRLDILVRVSSSIPSNIIEVLLFSGLAVYFIGPSAFAGLAIMVGLVPVNKWIFKKMFEIDEKSVDCTDERVKVTNETVQGILGVKSSAWEEKFERSIGVLRNKEIKTMKKLRIYDSVLQMMIGALPTFTAAISIAVYTLAVGGTVNAPIIFATIISFERIRQPLVYLPDSINDTLQAYTSAKRLVAFLSLPEVDVKDMNSLDEDELDPDVHIDIRDGTFYWSTEPLEESDKKTKNKKQKGNSKQDLSETSDSSWVPVLTDINVKFRTGQITSILGPVGCGKTALSQVLLGELYRESGNVTIRGNSKIAYCAQDPWILNATISDNITLGSTLDTKRLAKVLKVCQLEHDLTMFPAGLATMIGEKGINLSGGQKARLSIARAAYSTAEIVVLDNPLSALDPGVAGKLFDECISKFMKGRTRILMTNQLHVLQHCDWIVVLEANSKSAEKVGSNTEGKKIPTTGRIQEQGTYERLRSAGLEFAALLEEFHKVGHKEASRDVSSSTNFDEGNRVESIDVGFAPELKREVSAPSTAGDDTHIKEQVTAGEKLMTDEERAHGAVTWSTYSKYFKAFGGWRAIFVILLLIIAARGAGFMSVKWVSFWTTSATSNYTTVYPLPESLIEPDTNAPLVMFSIGYIAWTVVDLSLTFVVNYVIMTLALNAAVRIHNALLKRVFGAPMSFFDTTPVGRIMNRFSKDIYVLDQDMEGSLYYFSFTLSFVITSLIVLIGTLPLFAVVVIPFGVVYWYVMQYFRPVNRDIVRLASLATSPLYAKFSELLGGTSTIRAYQVVDQFQDESEELVDAVTRTLAMRYASYWMEVRLELLGALGVAIIGVLAINGSRAGWLVAGDVGVSFQYIGTLVEMLQYVIFAYTRVESAMTSVERVLHYRDELEQEHPREFPSSSKDSTMIKVPQEWPSQGALEVDNLRMRYRKDTPLVLKGVTFSVKGGERIGICGRTGSGKSSLMKSLLRLIEPELDTKNGSSGPIKLDGIDISKIGLGPLRRAISVVSQDPTIFSGAIRINLDPFDEYSDADIWIALEKCGLKTFVQEAPGKLQMQVSEFGSNLSQGQRQLLVLARCLLEKSKVLLLDESTASLDFETDVQIQKAIRVTFSECTVLVVAHRIRTILDSDKILVLDDGKVAEYDTPTNLLANKSSLFYEMSRGQVV